ncbi:MAG: N5-carboxyaminoimidazole ribonucleotide synthase [Oligoflexia bacterium]|nr:MAG: N5-carboxyaminoimidazole ribonucleotide synthase [Oligoflexia bacterium]
MKKKSQIPNKRLGIIGGGQLARMMALEAHPLGLAVHILCEKDTDPAAQVTKNWHQGDPNNEKDQIDFLKSIDLLTFESELIDMDFFEKLEQSPSTDIQIFPRPSLMKELQDRALQKKLLQHFKIPTAHHLEVSNTEELDKAFSKFKGKFVLKKCRGGYDGYGTYYCKSPEDLKKLHSLMPERFIAEEMISFKKELALIFARSSDGSLIDLPLVQSHQEQSRCDWVVGPIKHPKVKSLIQKIKKALAKLNYVGVIAFEIFDTEKELLINEIAPRVHNSGHYSQDALKVSQFLLHLQCGLGIPLQKTELIHPAFAMINLIGQSTPPTESISLSRDIQGSLHWYGKAESRKGRKMGHLNYSGQNMKKLLQLGLKERKKFQL